MKNFKPVISLHIDTSDDMSDSMSDELDYYVYSGEVTATYKNVSVTDDAYIFAVDKSTNNIVDANNDDSYISATVDLVGIDAGLSYCDVVEGHAGLDYTGAEDDIAIATKLYELISDLTTSEINKLNRVT